MTWPAAVIGLGPPVCVLRVVRPGVCVTGMVTDEPAEATGPLGEVPLATAVSLTEPWSTSAWVTV